MKTRIEKDSLGPREIPADAYYGAQTDRAIENFHISGLHSDPRFIDAFLIVKKAAAIANREAGELDAKSADAIVKACDEILSGKLRDQFPIDVFQMGAGTALHMNVNEVLANRANEILGGEKGKYSPIHPNDHVNLGQSTNDVFPSAVRIALALILKERLHAPLGALAESLDKKGKEFDDVLKSARTHLQDAVPIRLGQEFRAYAEAVRRSHAHLADAVKTLFPLGIGGSAAGTGLNTAKGYRERVIQEIAKLTGLPFTPDPDMRAAMQSQQPLAHVSAALRNVAVEVSRICNDLRLLASGPTSGFAEIALPATAPGSSIMPGKVNPSILEMTNMVCFQVIAGDTAVAWAVQAGQLELNVMTPLAAFNLNFSVTILANALKTLREKCVDGITADRERCRHYAEASMGISTALNAHIGYAKAAELTKEALATGKTIPQIIREKKILPEDEIKRILDPFRMTEPGIPGRG